METPASKAVFLSYASQDADAARRIADALRAFGVEVWFDQTELRGGDAWDQKIRKQIHDCTLFMPVISATTQERGEGYFRREWHLATDRTMDLAEGVPFIVPVVVADIPQTAAAVPDAFLRVQWTHLPHGVPTPQFVEQVRRLLEAPRRPIREAGFHCATEGNAPADRRRPTVLVLAAVAVIVLSGAGIFVTQELRSPSGSAKPTSETNLTSPAILDRSIAVLPFKNLSDDKDANAFFADGVHEDVITTLSNIRGLKVRSSTSVESYRNTAKNIREIAQELRVACLLEGGVRRAGSTVRVTGKLIDARADAPIWAGSYDRELNAANLFAIQSELAQAIATELKTALSPQEKKLIEGRPTDNLAAYDLVLKARMMERMRAGRRPDYEEQIKLLQKAIALDPGYASAHAELSYNYSYVCFFLAQDKDSPFFKPGSLRHYQAEAKRALDRAVQLASESPEVQCALGDYRYFGLQDYDGAAEVYERVAREYPSIAIAYSRLAAIRRRQSRWIDCLAALRRADELDPRIVRNVADEVVVLAAGRRFEAARARHDRLLELSPEDRHALFQRAYLAYAETGSTLEMEQFLRGLPATTEARAYRQKWAFWRGELAEWLRLDRGRSAGSAETLEEKLDAAVVLAAAGDRAAARERLGETAVQYRTLVRDEPTASPFWRELGRIEAILGNAMEARHCVQRALEILPDSRDAVRGGINRSVLAFAFAWTGDRDRAIEEYTRLLRTPFGNLDGGNTHRYNSAVIHVMKRDPRYAPLRGDPRWEALLNDPKNNAPLF